MCAKKARDGYYDDFEPEPISQALDDLAYMLIDHAIGRMSEVGELSPTLVVADDRGNESMLSFDDEDVEECVDEICRRVRDAAAGKGAIADLKRPPVRYAFAYEGAIDEDGGGYEPAIIVEYGEKGLRSGYSAYLIYQNPGNPQEFVWTDPAAAGKVELLV